MNIDGQRSHFGPSQLTKITSLRRRPAEHLEKLGKTYKAMKKIRERRVADIDPWIYE